MSLSLKKMILLGLTALVILAALYVNLVIQPRVQQRAQPNSGGESRPGPQYFHSPQGTSPALFSLALSGRT